MELLPVWHHHMLIDPFVDLLEISLRAGTLTLLPFFVYFSKYLLQQHKDDRHEKLMISGGLGVMVGETRGRRMSKLSLRG